MRIRNTLAILFIILTAIIAVFAWPASNIKLLGQTIDWNGLNLATITNDKYKGELQFGDSLELHGGKKYIFSADLSIGEVLPEASPEADIEGAAADSQNNEEEPAIQIDYQAKAKSNAEKFGARLEHYGYQDFELRWSLENESILQLELTISKNLEDDEQILQLLASQGVIELWSQDPAYDPETATEEDSFSFFTGMIAVELNKDQIVDLSSLYSQKAGGYGFKMTFSSDALLPILIATQTETYRGTMLVIDGQPIATRSYQLENTDKEDSKPVMYMSSLVGDNFAINDAVGAVFRTGELDSQFNLQAVEEVEPILGTDYMNNIKLALILMFGFLSIILIYRYNWLGIYQVLYLLVNLIWGIALMKLFGTKLSLSLVSGILLGVLFILLLNLIFIRRLDTSGKMKVLMEKIQEVREYYRNAHFLALVVVFFASVINLFVVDQFAGAFGVLIFVSMLQLYVFTEIFLLQFIFMQNTSWKKERK
ncbi:hypothetical protein JW978_00970 [Candidatus Dojkabacteria bacterium]|nr:hypothetical protein [Candidatus Dojkabacteria bacterium]